MCTAADTKMFNVMSITKGAIGLCYHTACIPRDLPLPGLEVVTVGEALQNMTGFPDTAWDFDAFREVVDDPSGDLLAFAQQALETVERDPGTFHYNNLVWQILASSFEDLAGRSLPSTLSALIGSSGWVWDVTQGQPTGPSGIWMTRAAAKRLGEAVALPPPQPIPRGTFGHIADFDGYVNGWFAHGDSLVAVGWRVQFIVVKPDEKVRVQLVDDDFMGERSDDEWNFVRRTLTEA